MGKRMNKGLPKQFLLVRDKPVLMHTMQRFYAFNPRMQLILTLPEEWMLYWEELQVEYDFSIPHRVVPGGKERYHSILNALEYCQGEIIAVHDGVRPLVAHETIQRCFDAMKTEKAVVPVVAVSESLRKIDGENSYSVSRSDYRLVQTPQCFRREVLLEAYKRPYHAGITDDAGLVEECGVRIATVEGNGENIKITSPIDLRYAEASL